MFLQNENIDNSNRQCYSYWYSYSSLKNWQILEFIRDEPRFKVILARAKKVHEERVAKYGHLFDEE